MIDLIGYWGSVSVITLFLSFLPGGIVLLAFSYWLDWITSPDDLGDKLLNYIEEKYFSWMAVELGASLVLGGLFAWIIIGIVMTKAEEVTLINVVHIPSQFIAPYVGWLFAIVLFFLSISGISRKMYGLSKKLSKSLKDVE